MWSTISHLPGALCLPQPAVPPEATRGQGHGPGGVGHGCGFLLLERVHTGGWGLETHKEVCACEHSVTMQRAQAAGQSQMGLEGLPLHGPEWQRRPDSLAGV